MTATTMRTHSIFFESLGIFLPPQIIPYNNLKILQKAEAQAFLIIISPLVGKSKKFCLDRLLLRACLKNESRTEREMVR